MKFHFKAPRRKVGLAAGLLAVGLIVCFFGWKEAQHVTAIGHELAVATPGRGVGEREVAGIGAALVRPNVANGVVQIERVLPGSPAEQAGLRPGMNIHKVDGIPLMGLELPETTRLIRGPAGSIVRLELNEGVDGEKFTVEVTRQKLKL